MIDEGRNPTMAKCYNSIKYLVEKFSLINFSIKTNSRIHKIQTRNAVTQT